jgi:hypothetical protein
MDSWGDRMDTNDEQARVLTIRVDDRPDRRFWGARPPSSLRHLKTDEEFAREAQRQRIFDQRWRRRRSMILTGTFSAGVLTGPIPIENVLDALLRAIGIP